MKHNNKSVDKRTKREVTPQTKKAIVTSVDPSSYDLMKASWRFHRCWADTAWPISVNSWRDWSEDILPKLIEFQEKTWAEIKSIPKNSGQGSKHHNVSIEHLTKEGQEELKRLSIYRDTIFSLRLDGKKRLIGFLDRGVLEIFCYTPNHEFVKTSKKHT